MLTQSSILQSAKVQPLVSVIIPAYNAERFIASTLDSVLTQTYRNIEVLVVNDGSQDKTVQVVEPYLYRDQRVRLLHQENSGVAAARNLGIKKSKGEYIAPIDADDIWHSTNIEKQVKCMLEGGSQVGVVYSWSIDIDKNESPTGNVRASIIQGKVFKTLLLHEFIGNASATLIKRVCFDSIGYYCSRLKNQDPKIKYLLCEDWELYLRIAKAYEFCVVEEFLVGYRQLRDSMSCDYSAMARCHDIILRSTQNNPSKKAKILINLSKSSLYMHFARQCESANQSKDTLLWLYRAILTGFLTPMLHPDSYKLLLKSCAAFLKKTSPQPFSSMPKLPSSETQNICIERDTVFSQPVSTRVRVKFLLEHIIHAFLTYPESKRNSNFLRISANNQDSTSVQNNDFKEILDLAKKETTL